MNNSLCYVGIILLFAKLFFLYLKSDTNINNFKSMLTPDQLIKYESIHKNRLYIYTMGILLGLLFGYIYISIYQDIDYKLCKFIGIVMITKIAFYYLYPKGKLMLYNLETKEQFIKWADIYTSYKYIWTQSIILSIIVYIILYYGFN